MSCTTNVRENKPEVSNQTTVEQPAETPVNIVQKAIPFSGEFYQITNLGSINVEFTEGNYAITAEGPQNLVEMIQANVDSYVLTLSLTNEEKIDITMFERNNTHLTVHVSCPDLRLVATCSSGSFKSVGPIHSSSLHVGILGKGDIMMDSVITDGSFKYEGNGDGNAEFRYLKCTEANIFAAGQGATVANVDVNGKLFVENDSQGEVSVSGNASNTEILSIGSGFINADLTTDNMQANALMGKITLKGKYKHETIHEAKEAKITRIR